MGEGIAAWLDSTIKFAAAAGPGGAAVALLLGAGRAQIPQLHRPREAHAHPVLLLGGETTTLLGTPSAELMLTVTFCRETCSCR